MLSIKFSNLLVVIEEVVGNIKQIKINLSTEKLRNFLRRLMQLLLPWLEWLDLGVDV